MIRNAKKLLYLLPMVMFLGCPPCFNEQAYQSDVSLKAEALSLMDKAVSPYDSCAQEIAVVKADFEKLRAYDNGLAHNSETVGQIDAMMDPQQNSFYGFLSRWQAEGHLSQGFVQSAKAEIARHFDDIISFEQGKKRGC